MWQPELLWLFTLFHHEFRTNHPIAVEVLMVLAGAHVFGFSNPKPWADFLDVPQQQFSPALKDGRVSQGKKRRLRFMVKQAAEQRKPVRSQRAATRSRAGPTFSMDHRVMERCGNLRRCPWRW